MPAKSKKQQEFFGLLYAYKKGEIPATKVSAYGKKVAKSMSLTQLKEMASTKRKNLPVRVKKSGLKDKDSVGDRIAKYKAQVKRSRYFYIKKVKTAKGKIFYYQGDGIWFGRIGKEEAEFKLKHNICKLFEVHDVKKKTTSTGFVGHSENRQHKFFLNDDKNLLPMTADEKKVYREVKLDRDRTRSREIFVVRNYSDGRTYTCLKPAEQLSKLLKIPLYHRKSGKDIIPFVSFLSKDTDEYDFKTAKQGYKIGPTALLNYVSPYKKGVAVAPTKVENEHSAKVNDIFYNYLHKHNIII